ncbi:MAG: hypothetical protein Q9218_001965 [Villophora microphyllina]
MECMRNGFAEGVLLDGRFETISPLNNGSFGMVFLANDRKTAQSVAIKCLSKTLVSDGRMASGLEDHAIEITCHNRLGQHPNIVSLIHSFETEAHHYLVLEFCTMGDLYEAINVGRGPLETENVREFMLQLVNAVDFMHFKGIYHRDIKPENIFLAQDGSMKLGDFGLATTDTWSYESSVGSDRYMAPEQYDASETGYSPAKADVWAIGICLLNVLFSKNPFVTPTESDKLFADFARDSQSLFDVFANMSQDTFEVLTCCLAIDPAKRSLATVREKLQRVVTFTTDEEALDDFCNEDRQVVPPTANREPLRTPSIQSPQVDNGSAFPWAKALQMSPQRRGRQLSAIPDTESYEESLFPASERDRQSWYSIAQNSSLTSGFDSILEASVKSMVLNQPAPRNNTRSKPISMTGSLPIRPSKPLPTLSSIFGKKQDSVSKSWTDIWDEDEEDDFVEAEEALQKRREHNSRTWSQESGDEDLTVCHPGLTELKTSSALNSRTHSPQHGPFAEGLSDQEDFVFEDAVAPHAASTPRYSPPSKRNISPPRRSIMDKWAALGNRRRAYHEDDGNVTPQPGRKRSVTGGSWRDGLGFSKFSSNIGLGSARERKESFNSRSIMSLSYVLSFLYSQFFVTPPVPHHDFSSQTVIVTGSNTGLGLEAARHIVRLGAQKVILAVRNTEKGEAAKRSIEASVGRSDVLEVWPLDLTSYESVRKFATKANALARLDVLLSNAGLMTSKWQMAEEDELQVTTNVTSTFLLGLMLLPKLQETAVKYNAIPRLVVVASDLHFTTDLPERKAERIFERLNERETTNLRKRYAVTKLMEIFIVRELAKRINGSTKPKVIVNCLTPGACHSDFAREMSGIGKYAFQAAAFVIARSTEVGSRTLVAAAGAGEESHGEYMADSAVSNSVASFVVSAEGADTQKRLWAELTEKLERIEPGVTQVI